MEYQVFDANEWLYPDTIVRADCSHTVYLSSAKNAHTGFQILFNDLGTGTLAITANNLPLGVKLACYRLVDVFVEKNTGPVAFCAGEGEDSSAYTTRKAPFRVYDALAPVGGEPEAIAHDTQAYYLSFETENMAKTGIYTFDTVIKHNGGEYRITVRFRVYGCAVPEEEHLFISNWFSLSQMAERHKVGLWSEGHWEIIAQYGKLMRRTRQTHFLIPREILHATCDAEGLYHFDFSNAKRLITLFLSLGFRYIEGNLLAYRGNFEDDTFLLDAAGETIPALSDKGYAYLSQYLRAWREFLTENDWLPLLYQHVADEPIPACASEYRILSGIVRKFLPGVPLMEAVEMSDLDGAVDIWIPKNSWYYEHREEFERKRKNGDRLWFYTCCFPGGFYLNRLWDMPLIRTRLLHTGNYRYKLEGYLHWGLNFCDQEQDPFNQKDIYFPPGDTHITYPASDGPWGSMRLEMMRCGVEDYELLTLLAKTHKPLADKIAEKWLPAFDNAHEDIADFSMGHEALLQALENAAHFITKTVNPLVKILPDEEPKTERYTGASALIGERVSYQIMYTSNYQTGRIAVQVTSAIARHVRLFSVGLVPCELPNYADHDEYLIRTTPGLYPDVLYPIEPFDSVGNGTEQFFIDALPGQYRGLWVYVDTAHIPAGSYEIEILFRHTDNGMADNDAVLAREWFTLEVLPVKLAPQRLIHTEWFYMDCLATMYGVEVFSDEHKRIVENYVTHYASHGMNMILTPVFSPPLEMDFGGDRPTVQLVGVTKEKDLYTFDFSLLSWFVDMCREKGIRYFEFSHLFTQWGAAYAPKVMAVEEGAYKLLFGWGTLGNSPEYRDFVRQFLTAVDVFIRENGLADCVFFHVSDEPNLSCIDSYRQASETVKSKDFPYPVLDALSDYAFYKNGFVDCPVSSTEHIGTFLENNVPHLWAYYCCCEYKNGLSNRFINMPGERTRVIGFQLYKYRIEGFLHWGYNHWYSGRSRIQNLDPYRVTDAAHSFPSGDAFLVYPGKNGKPVDSIRMLLMEQAMQDIRAAQLLEEMTDRDAVLAILDKNDTLTFTQYTHTPEALLAIRNALNEAIRKAAENEAHYGQRCHDRA